jgi:DUF4097 and DUF4098 domain-containing protein YvlB
MHTTTSKLARSFSAFSLLLATTVAASAETRDVIHKVFPMEGPGQIAVGAENADVFISVWDQPQTDVTVTRVIKASSEAKEKELLGADKVNVSIEGNKVTVALDIPNGWGGFKTRRDYRVDIKAPATCSAGLRTSGGDISVDGLQGGVEARTSGGGLFMKSIGGDVKALTSGGDVQLEAISGAIDANTSGGDIRVNSGAGRLTAQTSGGDIRVENLSGDINAGTSGGDIHLSGIRGATEASTSGGDVHASFVAQPSGIVKLTTTGGDVHITLPASVTAHIDARTVGGDVNTDFPLSKPEHGFATHMTGDVNGGGVSVELYTTGGDIGIVKGK